MRSYMDRYTASESKLQKMVIISEIVTKVRVNSPDGGFVKLKGGRWYEVGDHFAREKCSQNLRDLCHTHYRSSCRSKAARRRALRENKGPQKEMMRPDNLTSTDLSLPVAAPSMPALRMDQHPSTILKQQDLLTAHFQQAQQLRVREHQRALNALALETLAMPDYPASSNNNSGRNITNALARGNLAVFPPIPACARRPAPSLEAFLLLGMGLDAASSNV